MNTKKRRNIACGLLALLTLVSGCQRFEGEHTIPAYLHLDRMYVVNNAESLSPQAGFFTSNIDAVQVELWFEGDDATTQLGTFTLPFTIPVLNDKKIEKIHLYPFVKQNGLAATRIYYPYYEYVVIEDVDITPDSTTNLGTTDADGLWAMPVHYYGKNRMAVLADEYFEPGSAGSIFDTMMTAVHYDNNACSGAGYGKVHVAADKATVEFKINTNFKVADPTKIIYLEMDVRNDMRLSVQMRSSYTVGAAEEQQDIMTIYEHSEWKKMYINLGGAWADFSHNPNFSLQFTAINAEGKEGDICIDNVKIITI